MTLDLDDVPALRSADATGALLHASMAGAQLRTVATAAADGALAGIEGLRPRTVLWVAGRSDRPREAADIVSALAAELGGHSTPPIVRAERLPAWTGALDLVLVSGDDPGDPALAGVVAEAARRGAALVLDLPREGPVRDAAPRSAAWLEPLPYAPPDRGVLRHVGAGLAVLHALGSRALDAAVAADAVDAELEGLGPDLATPVNPAKLLATAVSGTDPVLWVHADPVSGAVSRRAVAAFRDAGRITAASTVADAIRASAERAALGAGGGDPLERLFHDDEIDGVWNPGGPRHLGMVLGADEDLVRRAAAPLADLEWVTARGADVVVDADRAAAHEPGASSTPELGRVVALMARIELAAAYLLVGSN